jgi:hypothetical protein
MKTKRIKSNKMKIIHIIDIIVLLICIYRTKFFISFVSEVFHAFKLLDYNKGAILLLSFYTIWFYLIVLIFKNFLILAIYLAYRIPRVRTIKKNSKYEVIDNFSYYRERFKGITPAEISLLTDLEIETKKDISAAMLDLYGRKIISFDNKKVIINKNNKDDLRESEKLLISMLQNKSFNSYSINTWGNLCINEAIEDNLIQEKIQKKFNILTRMSIVGKWFLVLIAACLLGSLYTITPSFRNTFNDLNEYDKKVDKLEEDDVVKLIKTDKEFRDLFYRTYRDAVPLAIIFLVIFISIIALFSMPIYLRVRWITYKLVDEKSKYERTSEGKVLVEQIVGMKNFIHDFSNLKENEKESVILWNDFLVYAVLLEENEKIIKDIFKYKNVDTKVLELVNENINIENK